MPRYKTRRLQRKRRHLRLRRRIIGTPDRPRVCVFRSLRHVYCQAIDDMNQRTLCAATSLEADLRNKKINVNLALSRKVGERLGQRLETLGIRAVVFDRGGYRYHGLVRALCEGLRDKKIQV